MKQDTELIGRRFGKLLVQSFVGKNAHGYKFNCLCDCGKTRVAVGNKLLSGKTTCCTCASKKCLTIDETGKRFGKLLVVRLLPHSHGRGAEFECLCDCGKSVVVAGCKLREPNKVSCGCAKRPPIRKGPKLHAYEPSFKTASNKRSWPEYSVWQGIKTRCQNPVNHDYVNYGARGITVCDLWRRSFDSFVEDMGDRPSHLHSIDRIDNDKGYYKGNCRWATTKEQNRNKRQTKTVEFLGKTMPLSEVAEITGVSHSSLSGFIRRGKSVEQAIERRDELMSRKSRRVDQCATPPITGFCNPPT